MASMMGKRATMGSHSGQKEGTRLPHDIPLTECRENHSALESCNSKAQTIDSHSCFCDSRTAKIIFYDAIKTDTCIAFDKCRFSASKDIYATFRCLLSLLCCPPFEVLHTFLGDIFLPVFIYFLSLPTENPWAWE